MARRPSPNPKHIAPETVLELDELLRRIVNLPVHQYLYLVRCLDYEIDGDDGEYE